MWREKVERRVEKGYWVRWFCWLVLDDIIDLNILVVELELECLGEWMGRVGFLWVFVKY